MVVTERKYREYQNVLRKIGRIKAIIAAGALNEFMDISKEGMDAKAKRAREKLLRIKSIRIGTQRQHVTNPDHEIE